MVINSKYVTTCVEWIHVICGSVTIYGSKNVQIMFSFTSDQIMNYKNSEMPYLFFHLGKINIYSYFSNVSENEEKE